MAGRINLRGYDPRLAEEADQRQKEFAQNQLGQIGELGSIQTQGIRGLGETASDAVTGGVNSYLEGQKIARDKEAHALRAELAQQNIDAHRAEEEYLDSPARNSSLNGPPSADAPTNRQRRMELEGLKAEEELNALKRKGQPVERPMTAYEKAQIDLGKERNRIADKDKSKPSKLQQTQLTGPNGEPLLYDPESGAYTPGKVPEGFTSNKDAGTEVYGAEKLPGLKPTPADAETVKKSRAARDAIAKNMERLDALYDKHGTKLVGAAATDMESITTDIQLNLKELQNLGVLNGPDLALLQKQVPDPSDAVENVKGAFGRDTFVPKRNSFAESLENKFETGIQARGYKRTDKRLNPFVTKKDREGTATAAPTAPAGKSPEEMTPEERAAELARLRGK